MTVEMEIAIQDAEVLAMSKARSAEHIATKLETIIVDDNVMEWDKKPILDLVRQFAERGTIDQDRAEKLLNKAPVPVGTR